MKVSIEIPKKELKKAAYLLLSRVDNEEQEEIVNKAVEACEQAEEIIIPEEVYKDESEITLAFALSALTMKVEELEKKGK